LVRRGAVYQGADDHDHPFHMSMEPNLQLVLSTHAGPAASMHAPAPRRKHGQADSSFVGNLQTVGAV
ncbi:hypothetical protein AB1A84_14080, partial [Stenotrophomonas maltophilia]|uniref:hypothetical protein n=1 Tax=Stenotrophomonas maltophilia TaxID=40324 RepID=UPI003456EDD4